MTEPQCRLYLVLAPDSAVCRSREDLERVLDAGDIACVLLRCGEDRSAVERARAATAIAQTRDIAVVVEDDPELANDIHADGVHLTGDIEGYDRARRLLPEDAIVGVDAADSRHRAMDAGERGADYIAIAAANDDMVAWWTSIFQIPCVAVAGDDLDAAGRAIRLGAEFVALDATAWADADTGTKAIADLTRLIEQLDREPAQ